MTRNTMLVYLKNLRDLEVAKYKLEARWRQEKSQNKQDVENINREANRIQAAHYEEVPKPPVGWIIWTVFCLFGFFVLLSVMISYHVTDNGLLNFGIIGYAIFFIIALIICISRFRERREAIQHNKEEKHRLEADVPQQVQAYQQQLRNKQTALQIQNQRIQQEYNQVSQLLTKAYSLNVIPGQHRNLASVYYIYDYMSTSQATFEETLIHEHMENGIQRILEKLDVIIAQNEELILHARRVEANTRETADNTRRILENEQRMLASVERTEQNTADAAQAASVAAQYSAANAFFSAAQYIEIQRGR